MRIEVRFQQLSLLFLSLVALGRIQASTVYVSTGGNDSNAGTAAQPFRTITHAYSVASPGVTILVLPGVYTDYTSRWGIHIGANGTAGNPIILKSETPGAAVIDGQNAADRNVGFYIDGNYNIIDGFEIRNAPNGGITIWANNNQILNCNIHNNGNPPSSSSQGQDGIYSNEGTSGNIYSANNIHHNGRTGSNLDHGLYLCGQNEVVINNVLFANAASGVQVAGYTTVSNLKIYNNVMAFNGTDGVLLWQTLSGIDIKNNILYKNGHYGIASWDAHGSGVVMDHNLSFGNAYTDFNFVDGGSDYSYNLGAVTYADPLLIAETTASLDPHLSPGSPAIQAGINLYSFFTTDMTGAARLASGPWDLGPCKYEASSGATNQTLPTVTVAATIPTAIIGTTNYGAFTFTRTGDGSLPLTVNYSLGGTAVKWNDYYRLIGGDMPVAISIPAGASAYTMQIVARDNQTGSNPEFVTLTLSPDPAYQVGSPSSATMTIISNTPTAVPPITVGITKVPKGRKISWNSLAGKTYRVAYKNNLAAPWSDLSGNITATDLSSSWIDTTADAVAQRFYAVYVLN